MPPGNFFMPFLSSADFFQNQLLKKIQEYHLSVKQIGSRSGPILLSGLVWVQSVCKGYKQSTQVGKELSKA